jgi:hypothetical protein
MPFLFPNTQFPPMRSDFLKQSNGIPRSLSALTTAIPEEPAPITHAEGSLLMDSQATRVLMRPGGPRSIWTPRRVREVGAQFPDRQGRVSPSHALDKHKFRPRG